MFRAVWSVEYYKPGCMFILKDTIQMLSYGSPLSGKENLLEPLDYAAIRMKLQRIL